MEKFLLNRTKQCKKCPWKVSVDPLTIPDGYSVEKHKALSCTIAKDASFNKELKVMACHESSNDKPEHCIGWLNNQLGPGNNIPLRISMMHCSNISSIELDGLQHATFEDTLPKCQG